MSSRHRRLVSVLVILAMALSAAVLVAGPAEAKKKKAKRPGIWAPSAIYDGDLYTVVLRKNGLRGRLVLQEKRRGRWQSAYVYEKKATGATLRVDTFSDNHVSRMFYRAKLGKHYSAIRTVVVRPFTKAGLKLTLRAEPDTWGSPNVRAPWHVGDQFQLYMLLTRNGKRVRTPWTIAVAHYDRKLPGDSWENSYWLDDIMEGYSRFCCESFDTPQTVQYRARLDAPWGLTSQVISVQILP